MKITPVEHGLDLHASDLVRSPGLHMSELYGDLYAALEPKRYGPRDEPMNPEVMALGTAWENHLEYLMKKAGVPWVRPGEFRTVDGIALSPDGLLQNGTLRLGEIKLTWMSSKGWPTSPSTRLPPKADKYITQMACYGHHLEIPDGRLYVLFVNGTNERGLPKPELRAFDVTFTARELKEQWQMVLNNAKRRGKL